jgi:hypothetical protein
MTTKISVDNIQDSTIAILTASTEPKITSIVVTNSSYVATGATTVPTTGGYVLVSGAGFVSGIQVLFDGASASAVSRVDSQTLQVQVPALAAGNYFVYVVNPDGSTGLRTFGLTVA